MLLNSACSAIKGWGLPVAEDYPRTPPDNPNGIPHDNLEFRGSVSMFLKSGFLIHKRFGRFAMMRKVL
jgi:hypothetical protein